MKLFNSKDDSLYLSIKQWRKLFLAMSIMTLTLYVIAMIFSLCGSSYFILNYQNEQMDSIQDFLLKYDLFQITNATFLTIEFSICLSFVIKKIPKWYYIISFLALILLMYYAFRIKGDIYTILFFIVIAIIALIDSLVNKKLTFKSYMFSLLRLLITIIVTLILEVLIYMVKTGCFTIEYQQQTLSSNFIYAIEHDIALSVILTTILLAYKEKGDSKTWTESQHPYGSSQTSKKQSQKSNSKKNLTKTQKNKIRWLFVKLYLVQLGGFLLLMVLPFLLGKVLEFLVMYLAFAVARFILGFKYSLHYKKEATCITVGVVVFGVLSLAIPFFTVNIILALLLGIGLAVLLHLSYRYKGMYLFTQVAKPDKFALLYTFFDGDIEEHHVRIMCNHKGLDKPQTDIIVDFTQGNKIYYLAHKYNYSQRMLIYKLDEAIDKLIK